MSNYTKHFPFVLGTDITKLSRWEIGEDPIRIIGIAHRILHTEDFEHMAKTRPAVYKLLDPLETRRRGLLNRYRLNPEDYKTQLRKVVTEAKYRDLMTPINLRQLRERLAGRFAIKEAAIKAWSPARIGYRDLFVGSAYPLQVFCSPTNTKIPFSGQASLSHDGDYCVATVIAQPLPDEMVQTLQQGKTSNSFQWFRQGETPRWRDKPPGQP